jgi:hypothetical protein
VTCRTEGTKAVRQSVGFVQRALAIVGVGVGIVTLCSGCVSPPVRAGSGAVPLASPKTPAEAGLPNFGEVRPGVLYRGGQPVVDRAAGVDGYRVLVEKYKVHTIVDLMNEPVDHWILQKRGDCSKMGRKEEHAVRYVHLSSYEAFPRRDALVTLLRILRDSDNLPVFLHCADGENRTGAIVGGYRIVADGWRPVDAEAEMEHFGVLAIWRGINDRFIDEALRDRDDIRRQVTSQKTTGAVAFGCGQ